MFIALYVDDIVIAYNEDNMVETLFTTLQNNFDIKDLGQPKCCIGLYIKHGQLCMYVLNMVVDKYLFLNRVIKQIY